MIKHAGRFIVMIQTSLIMNVATFNTLVNEANRTKKTLYELIKETMYRYAKKHTSTQIAVGAVKYQERDEDKKWKVFRIELDDDDYELFTDMRKVMKKSVSLLVAEAIKEYLDEIVKQILKNINCYMDFRHESRCETKGSHITWILNWEIKKKTQKIE